MEWSWPLLVGYFKEEVCIEGEEEAVSFYCGPGHTHPSGFVPLSHYTGCVSSGHPVVLSIALLLN